MEFPDFSSDMLAVLNEDQRVIVLEEMHSLLGKGERNIAAIAGLWKARATLFEQNIQVLPPAEN